MKGKPFSDFFIIIQVENEQPNTASFRTTSGKK
jgi:hypothetical protein